MNLQQYKPKTACPTMEYQIKSFLDGRYETCINQIWVEALGENPCSKPTRQTSNLIAGILRVLGWKASDKSSRIGGYGVQRVWQPVIAPCSINCIWTNCPRDRANGCQHQAPIDNELYPLLENITATLQAVVDYLGKDK